MSKPLSKNPRHRLSRALAREHLSQAGLKPAAAPLDDSNPLKPLTDALNRALSGKADSGLSKRFIKNLAKA